MDANKLSFICKMERLKKGVTIRQLAEIAFSSSSVISKFENSMTIPKEDALACITDALEIEIFDDEKIVGKWQSLIAQAFYNIVHFNYQEANKYFEELMDDKSQILVSNCCIDFHLLEIAINLHYYRSTDLGAEINLLNEFEKVFDASQLRTFYYLKAFNQGLHDDYGLTIEWLWKAYENNSLNATIPDELIYFQIGFSYSSLNNAVLSIKYTSKAKEMFDKKNSFRRSLYALVNISNQYIKLGNFDYAEEILETIITNAKSFGLDYIASLSYNLLSTVKLSKGENEKALELAKLSLANKPASRNDMYYTIILASYRLGLIDETKDLIKKVEELYSENKGKRTYLLVKYIEMLVDGKNDEELTYYLRSLVDREVVSSSIMHKKYVVRQLMSIYERNRKYKEAYLLCKSICF